MQVGVLGPLTVRVGDRDVTPRGGRLRDVFVVLLQRRGRPVPAEVVLDLVWADDAAGLDMSVVHTVVARLRRLLGRPRSPPETAAIVIDVGATTDEDEFTRAGLVGTTTTRCGAAPASPATATGRPRTVARTGGLRRSAAGSCRGRPCPAHRAPRGGGGGTGGDAAGSPRLGSATEALELGHGGDQCVTRCGKGRISWRCSPPIAANGRRTRWRPTTTSGAGCDRNWASNPQPPPRSCIRRFCGRTPAWPPHRSNRRCRWR